MTLNKTGNFSAHPRGFGFVTTPSGKYFTPPPLARNFLNGDRVEVTEGAETSKGLTAQRLHLISRELTHALARVVMLRGQKHITFDTAVSGATLRFNGNQAPGTWLLLDVSTSLTNPKVVRTWKSEDPTLWRELVLRRHGFHTGQSVPTRKQLSEAALGDLEQATVELREALECPPEAGRRDLSMFPTFTIDGETSKDLDDAISAAIDGSDIRMWVHIADVSSAVVYGLPLDEYAYSSATSVYLPGWNRPMLPPELSEDLLSLLPGQTRNALTVEFLVRPDGSYVYVDVYRSRINSDHRFNYIQVDGFNGLGPEVLQTAQAAAKRIGEYRSRRNLSQVDLERTGALRELSLTPGPNSDDPYAQGAFALKPAEPATESMETIERIMVAANECVAHWMRDNNLPVAYRHHPEANPARVGDLLEAAQLKEAAPDCTPGEDDFAGLADTVSKALGSSALAQAVAFKNMERAAYSATEPAHDGLAAPAYLHFTSPIRRYADLWVHHAISAYLDRDSTTLQEMRELNADVCSHITERSTAAAFAEADLRRHVVAALLESAPDTTARTAVVSSINPKGLVVRLPDLAVNALVPFEKMVGDWEVSPRHTVAVCSTKRNPIALGDQVFVRVVEARPHTTGITARLAARKRPRTRR